MSFTEQHKGLRITIPNSDNGTWHYKVYFIGRPRKSRQPPQAARAEGYKSHDEALAAARSAIDLWLQVGPP